jgi:hypothetical protein
LVIEKQAAGVFQSPITSLQSTIPNGGSVALGLFFSSLLILLGIGTGARQFGTLRKLREEPYTPDIDKLYFRGQVRRRLTAAVLLVAIGAMIGFYYLSGMDARMNEIGDKGQDNPATQEDKDFARGVVIYWIVVLVLLALVGCVAVMDFWATRLYWMARYREMKNDHETRLRRDLEVYKHQQLSDRARGSQQPSDDTPPDGHDPVP